MLWVVRWRVGSEVKNTWSSCRGSGFSFWHHMAAHNYNSNSRGSIQHTLLSFEGTRHTCCISQVWGRGGWSAYLKLGSVSLSPDLTEWLHWLASKALGPPPVCLACCTPILALVPKPSFKNPKVALGWDFNSRVQYLVKTFLVLSKQYSSACPWSTDTAHFPKACWI